MARICHGTDRDISIRDHPDHVLAVTYWQNTDIKLTHEAGGIDERFVGADALRVRGHDLPDLHRIVRLTATRDFSHRASRPLPDGRMPDGGRTQPNSARCLRGALRHF